MAKAVAKMQQRMNAMNAKTKPSTPKPNPTAGAISTALKLFTVSTVLSIASSQANLGVSHGPVSVNIKPASPIMMHSSSSAPTIDFGDTYMGEHVPGGPNNIGRDAYIVRQCFHEIARTEPMRDNIDDMNAVGPLKDFDFNGLPSYVMELSNIESNIIFLGPHGLSNYQALVLQGGVSQGCKENYRATLFSRWGWRYELINFKVVSEKQDDCILHSHKYDTKELKLIQVEQRLAIIDLPLVTCESKSRYTNELHLNHHPPGEAISFTPCQLLFGDYHIIFNNQNGSLLYVSRISRPCTSYNPSRRLASIPCNIELEQTDPSHTNEVRITMLGSGEVTIATSKYLKNEYCSHECSYPLLGSSYVIITCPNGFQHRLDVTRTFDEMCPGSNSFIGWFALMVCRGSSRPIILITAIIWFFLGTWLLPLLYLILIWITRGIEFCLSKARRNTNIDEEIGSCSYCGCPFLDAERVRDHKLCRNSVCPFCKKSFATIEFKSHCPNCPGYKAARDHAVLKNQSTSRRGWLNSTMEWLEGLMYFKFVNRGIYFILLIILIIWSASPVSSEQVNSGIKEILNTFYENNDDITDVIDSRLNLDFFSVFEAESNMCGIKCWNGPNRCNCPDKEKIELKTSNLLQEIKLLHDVNKQERDMINKYGDTIEHRHEEFIGNGSIQEEKEIRQKREVGEESYEINQRPELRFMRRHVMHPRLTPLRIKRVFGQPVVGKNHMRSRFGKIICTDCHLINSAYHAIHQAATSSDNQLYTLEQVQTQWGLVSISSDLGPTYDSTNINLEWQTVKKTDKTVTLKGIATGKLNIGHLSGMTWTIGNADSNEKIRLSLFIYDVSQRYVLKLKKVTGSRYVDKWFRGTCTTDCPENCACSTNTCFRKVWNYDRKWTCNPLWCWALNDGCSCCAADLKKQAPRWTIVKSTTAQIDTSIVFCLKLGNDKLHCELTTENKKITFQGVTVTVGKPTGEIKHLPSEISSVYYNPSRDHSQFAHPNYFWTDDDICIENCNHGSLGDIGTYSLSDFLSLSTKNSSKNAQMSWTGVDIEHTCHAGHWPSCQFYNMYEDIDDQIKNINITSKHLQDEFELKYYNQGDTLGYIGVLPKFNTGTIDFTVQVNNLVLNRKNIKLSITSLNFDNCGGCYGCTSGFYCKMSVKSETYGNFVIHLKSKNPLITIDQSSLVINVTKKLDQQTVIHGVSLLNDSTAEICIVESDMCSIAKLNLNEPVKRLAKRETIISIQTNEQLNPGSCSGWSWFYCTLGGIGRLFSNFWDWLVYLWNYAFTVVIIILSLFASGIVLYFVIKLVIYYKHRKMTKISDRKLGNLNLEEKDPIKLIAELKERDAYSRSYQEAPFYKKPYLSLKRAVRGKSIQAQHED